MTIPLDAVLTTTLGTAFYTAAKKHIEPDTPLLTTPYYKWGMVYNIVVGMGIAIIAYLLNPDWMWMYWVDTSRLSFGFTAYVFLMYPTMFTMGFLMADQVEKIKKRGSFFLLIALNTVLFLFILLTLGRIWKVGTISQWDAGTTVPMIGPGFSVTPLAVILAICFVFATIAGFKLLMRFIKGLN